MRAMRSTLSFFFALALALGAACTPPEPQKPSPAPETSIAASEPSDVVPPSEATAPAASDEQAEPGAELAHEEHAHGGHAHGAHDPLVEDGVRGRRFARAEKWTKRFDAADRQAWQRPVEVVALMKIESGMSVADIGAGTGYFLSYLSAAVGKDGRVHGLDIEADMVRHMTERAARENLANVEARAVDPNDPQLPAASLDRILIVNTWHHIDRRAEYAKKLAAGLRPGGAVIIVDYTLDTPKGPPKNHRLDPKIVMAELEAGGLHVKLAKETLPRQFVVIGRLP